MTTLSEQRERQYAQRDARVRHGRFVCQSRLDAGLTQDQFAALVQMTKSRISRVERGHARLTPGEIETITRALATLALRQQRAAPVDLTAPPPEAA